MTSFSEKAHVCLLHCANIKSTISYAKNQRVQRRVGYSLFMALLLITHIQLKRIFVENTLFFLLFFVWIISSQFGEMQQVAGAVSQIIPNKTLWRLSEFFIVEVSIPFWHKLLHIVIIVDKNFFSFKGGKISEWFFPY